MNPKVDILVIGGGISGCAIFYELSRSISRNSFGSSTTDSKSNHKTIALVEAGEIAGATTGESGGYIRKFNLDPYLGKLAAESFDYYQNFAQEVGGSCDFRRTGLVSRVSLESLPQLMPQIEALQASGHGIVVSDYAPTNNLRQAAYNNGDSAFIYEPTLGNINTKLACRSWVKAACNNGGAVLENTRIEKILVKGDRIYGVQTSGGIIECETIVLSAGAWSKDLLASLPIDASGITARSFQYNIYLNAAQHLDIAFMDNIAGFYIAPFRNGNLFVGSLGEDQMVVESHFNHEINDQLANHLHTLLQNHFPWVNMNEVISAQRSYDAFTEDGKGVVKTFSELPGLVVATGWSSGGIKSAPAIAKQVAQLVSTGITENPQSTGGAYAFHRN